MKAISFLGTGRYAPTTYHLGGEVASVTNLFPKALCELFQPEELLIVVTEQAKKAWLDKLETEVETLKIKVTPVDIPEGHTVKDLWSIFGKLTEKLNEKDKVIFDITHSFRTLPFLSFLAASYLRVAKNVEIKGVYYGAWEARIPQPPPENPLASDPTDRSPVFDLTPFLELLDWTTATDQFLKTGNADSLAQQLQPQAQPLAENINRISQGLHLLRPHEVMTAAADLPQEIKKVKAQVEKQIPPFALLMERVEQGYGKFGAKNLTNDRERLIHQLEIGEWYKNKGQFVHALSIAREWLPSLLCYCFSLDALDKNVREKMEELLNGHSFVPIKNSRYEWATVAHGDRLRRLWNNPFNLAKLRNDVLHAGFRRDALTSEEVLTKTKEVLNELREIAKLWNLF